VFERRPVMRLRLFAPLRAKVTSSAQSLVPLFRSAQSRIEPINPTEPHDELAALHLLRSFDHLVGEREQPVRNLKAERPRWQSVSLVSRPAIFDHQIPAFNVAGLVQTSPETGQPGDVGLR